MLATTARLFALTGLAIFLASGNWSTQAQAPPTPPPAATIRLPESVKGQVGNFIRIPAETNGKEVRWLAIDLGLNVFPMDLLRSTREAVVTANQPGRYRLAAWTAAGDVPSDAAVCVVIIGDPPAPVPPGPGPTPPGPEDPLVSRLQVAYAADSGKDKLGALAELYLAASKHVLSAKETTVYAYYQVLAQTRRERIGDALPIVRQVLTEEMNKTLPTSTSAPLDAATKDQLAKVFLRLAEALSKVKP